MYYGPPVLTIVEWLSTPAVKQTEQENFESVWNLLCGSGRPHAGLVGYPQIGEQGHLLHAHWPCGRASSAEQQSRHIRSNRIQNVYRYCLVSVVVLYEYNRLR